MKVIETNREKGKQRDMNTNLIETLSLLPPFNFLNKEALQIFLRCSTLKKYPPRATIYRVSEPSHDFMSILLSGTVLVQQHKKTINTIHAVSYFGERSVLLGGHRKANIIAKSHVECLDVPGELIRKFIKNNITFSHAFAKALNNKLNLFFSYHQFLAMLYQCRHEENFNIAKLMPYYLELNPLLHKHARREKINFPALKYALSRLPNNITEISHFSLLSEFPKGFMEHAETLRVTSRRSKKRLYLDALPGKVFIILRDEIKDFIDFTTNLCLYYCETKKILRSLSTGYYQDKDIKKNAINAIVENHIKKHENDDEFIKKLYLTDVEKQKLFSLFDKNIVEKMYGIIVQNGFFDIHVEKEDAKYSILSQDMWVNKIQKAFEKFIGQDYSRYQIHIIFSNHHSVNNCLSSWLHQQEDTIMSWGKGYASKFASMDDIDDKLYVYSRYWKKDHSKEILKRVDYDFHQGILSVDDKEFNGVDVSIVNLDLIKFPVDRHILDIPRDKFKNKIIINIDYAYGYQAQTCLENIVFLFGKAVKSISIMGKSGATLGSRGDVIIPRHIIDQKDNDFMPVINQSLTLQDLHNAGWKGKTHQGNMLTVLGTLMQNQAMLAYYQLFWQVIGMEMEASHYLKAIYKSINTDMLDPHVNVNMAYYISDIPVKPAYNLSRPLKPSEGIPAVYSITRAILRHILLQH